MPTLHWIGKDKVVSHHQDVPYKILDHKYGFDEKGQSNTETNSGNKIIHGDNLEALKALLPEYEGKVKCIYIDPPYNTGQENWVYNDNVNSSRMSHWLGEVVGKEGDDFTRHDKWMCMMYPRLKLLHKLLADDGAIFISLDENEIVNARLMCNDIFGSNNFIAQLTLLCNPKGRSQDKYFATNHEYCLVYSKTLLENGSFSIDKEDDQILKDYKIKDDVGRYRLMELRNTHREFNKENRPNLFYPIYINPEDNSVSLKQDDLYIIECYPNWNDGYEGCWTWGTDLAEKDIHLLRGYLKKSGWKVYRKSYAKTNGERPTKKLFTILADPKFYTEKGQSAFGEIFPGLNKNDFPQPKSVDFIMTLIDSITNKDSLILDSFAGSGTTAQAVLKLNKKDNGNRKFILVEMEEYADNITATRIKKVIKGYEFSGKQKETLSEYSINVTNLKKADKVLKELDAYKNDSQYSKVSLTENNGAIAIVGEKIVSGKTEGIRGSFDFYELGKPIFKDDENLNEEVGEDKIRNYIYYTETKHPLTRPQSKKGKYLLDNYQDTGYYFYYEKDCLTTLDNNSLGIIKELQEQYIIYADICLLDEDYMLKKNIIFKKIPRDIKRF